ncbi:gp58-like family protein [Streptococcus suis]|nr:gp58-like family protein [Streptococcus suis]MDG4500511.1 gp58-like family protein [Streptococcus suis]
MVGTVTFNQAMLAKDRVFAIRAGTYTSSDIKEASFNYGYISGDTFKPGGTVAGSAKLTFTSIITSFNKLDKIYPEIGLLVGDSYEWVAMGEYFVNDISIDRNRNTTELDLMDGMFKLNQPYVSDLVYPAQIRDVIREICVKTGVELETDDLGFRAIQHHIQSKADKKDITFREVLSQAIQLLGFSAFFNRKGKLEIRGLTESNITITADNYFLHGLTKSELMYQIAGITCKKDKETLTVGLRTGRSLELENSFMIQNILDDLYYDLKNIRYYPYSLDWQGHLKLDVGQWVTLKTNKNETFKVPVLSQSFNFKGGLKSKIGADSKAGNDTQYAYKGFLGKRIKQMSTEIEAEVQQQLEYKDKEFDEKINKVKSEINDGIEQAKAEAELYADNIKQSIDTEIAQVEQSMQAQAQEHDKQVADILSKTQSVESLANQAKSDAASAIARANQVKTEAIADARAQVATVSQALNAAKTELQSAIASADQKARDSQASATALRNDLNVQASKILAQAQAQTALTNRVSTVETLADGTRSIVAELSKTVSKATGDIASVTSRTKTVEDTLSQTRTQYEALTQTVNTQTGQIESINRKTADLQSGIDGVTERFESLRIEDNLLLNSSFNENLNQWQGTGVTIADGKARIIGELNKTKYIYQSIKSQIANDDVSQVYIASISVKVTNYVAGSINPFLALYIDGRKNDSRNTQFGGTYLTANRLDAVNNRGVVQFATTFRINVPRNQIKLLDFHIYARDFTGEVEFEKVSLRRGDIDLGWQASPEDLRSEIASYKRTADEASAELSRQIQTVDGKAVDAKTYAQQTATAINTRLESLETYKNAEGTRASQYFTASRDETARQLTAERTAIATNYVAKSTYDENVRGTTLKLNEIKSTADNTKQNLATYQNTVDGKLEELTSSTQTLDGKINTASAKITQNANEISKRLTSTQVDKAITDKGYQTKSDVDNNITGRGYITSSALQPYALSTTVQNLVQETAGSFERQITETRGLIPTEVNQNLFDVVFSDLRATGGTSFVQSDDGWIEVTIKNRWSGFHWLYSDNIKPSEKQYVLSYEAYLVDTVANTAYLETDFGSPDQSTRINKTPKRYTVVLNRPANIYSYINFVCNSSETGKKFRIRNIKLEEGIVATPYIAPFPTTVLFNAVKDTVDAHKRLIGDGDSISQAIQSANKFERSISSGGDIYQAIETAKGLVTEVSGTNGLKTQVSQLAGSYAVKNLNSSGDILSQANLSSAQFLLEAAKIRLKGKTLADEIQAIDGKFGTLFVADGTFAKLNATVIGSQAITADKLKVDQAFFDKLMANDAYLRQLFAKDAFLTAVQAVTLSASKISGGILTATNGAMKVNLNAGQILYYTDQAALKRVLNGYPTQFVKFATGTVTGKGNAGVTVIGSNRWNSESSNDGGFVGIRAWNGANIDQIDVVGDTVRLASSAFESADGWTINTLPGKLDIDAFNADHRASSKIKVGDLWLWKNATTYSSMRDTINLIIDNLQLLHNNKSTERGYSYTLPAKV